MKKLLYFVVALAFAGSVAFSQITLRKNAGNNTLDTASNPVVIGNGQTFTIASGGNLFLAPGSILSGIGVSAQSSLDANHITIGNGGTSITVLGSLGTTSTVLHGNAAGAPLFGSVDLGNDVIGNLTVTHLNGGTTANSTTFWRGDGSWAVPPGGGNVTGSSLTSGNIIVGGGSNAIAASAITVSGGNLTAPNTITANNATISRDATVTNNFTANNITATNNQTTVNLTSTGTVDWSGAAFVGGVPVPNGGSGQTSYTKGDIVAASAATTLGKLAVGTNGKVITANSSASLGVSWETPSTGSGNVTNNATLTDNRIALGGGTTAIGVMASAGTATTVLHGNASGPPTFGPVSLSGGDVTATLGPANGGTGVNSFTKGDLIAATGSVTLAKLAVGTDGQLLISNSTQSTGLSWASGVSSAVLPWLDAQVSYGASGNATTTTGNVSASSTSLLVAGAGGYVIGQGILIKGAGASIRSVADGVTTSSSTTITSATLAFVSSDIGKAITGTGITAGTTIAGITSGTSATLSAAATASGSSITFTIYKNKVTTISAISGTTITLASAVTTTVTNAVVQHDDSAAINAALAAAYTANGARVLLRSGRYRCALPLDGSTNSILTLPQDLNYSGAPIRVELIGEARGKLNNAITAIISGGTTIDATDAEAGTGTDPAIFAGAATAFNEDLTGWENVDIFMENILFVTVPNPTISGLNFNNCARGSVGNSLAILALTPAGTFIQPTHTSVALILPGPHNNVYYTCGTVQIAGFGVGIRAADHANFQNPGVFFCNTGVQIENYSSYPIALVTGHLIIENCPVLMEKLGTGLIPLDISLAIETNPSGNWYSRGAADILDSSNSFSGNISCAMVTNSGSPLTPSLIINGGANLRPATNLYIPNYARVVTSSQGSVTFTIHPTVFNKFRVSFSARSGNAVDLDSVFCRFNADSTSAHYEAFALQDYIVTSGTVHTIETITLGVDSAFVVGSAPGSSGVANRDLSGDMLVPSSNSPFHKDAVVNSMFGYSAATGAVGFKGKGVWKSTAAITSVTLYIDSGNFVDGSTFTLTEEP